MLFWFSLAFAGVPLVYESDGSATAGAAVVAQVAGITGLSETQFSPIPLDTILKEAPQVQGDAVLRACAGPGTRNAELLASAIRAESAWKEANAQLAMDELDLGIGGLGCLSERVDAALMARMFLLRGGLMARAGLMEEARGELRSAIAAGFVAEWPAHFPEEGAVLFAEVLNEKERVELTVFPTGIAAAPAIDGATATVGEALSLRSGLHLLQVPGTSGLKSYWLTASGVASVVIPGNYREPILARLLDVPLQDEVEVLLLTATDSEAVYVSYQGSLFLVTRDATGTHTNPLVLAAPPPESSKTKKGKTQR